MNTQDCFDNLLVSGLNISSGWTFRVWRSVTQRNWARKWDHTM